MVLKNKKYIKKNLLLTTMTPSNVRNDVGEDNASFALGGPIK